MRGIVSDQKRNRRQRRSRNTAHYRKPGCDDSSAEERGGSGGVTSPGCGSVAQFQSLFRQKRRKRAQNCDTLTPESHANANTPTETIPRPVRRGAMFFAWLRWERIYVQEGASLPDQAATTERRDTSPLRRKERREPPAKKARKPNKRGRKGQKRKELLDLQQLLTSIAAF